MNREPTSILAFRNGSIGNTLAAVPALRALRARWPSARITVVVDSIGYELLEYCPWIDRLIIYDKHGRDRGLLAQFRLVRTLRRLRPSHAVLFKRFFRNGLLAYLSGARTRIGFVTDGKAPLLNVTAPYEVGVSVVDIDLRLAALLDAPPVGRHLEVFLSESDAAAADRITGHVEKAEYIVAHYGGSTTQPDFFPIERFATLLGRMCGMNHHVVLIGSGRSEEEWAREIASCDLNATVATGLPVRTTAALIRDAKLFLGFNSGPAHLAAAVCCPSLVVFKPDARVSEEIRKWLPPSESARAIVPPETDGDDAWDGFCNETTRTADELMGSRTPSKTRDVGRRA